MKPKIFIVDDSHSVRLLLQSILEVAGYAVKIAVSGEEALDTIPDFIPDLILLDVVMGGISGLEVCRQIRERPEHKLLKIIMVSSESELHDRLKGYAVGADDYVIKPFNKEELLAKVRVFIRLKSVEDQLNKLNQNLNRQVLIRTRQLLYSEKMAAIGRNTAGIIHNLNNPLCAVMGGSELLAMRYPDDDYIMSMRKAATQMRMIITTILNTSHKEEHQELTRININEVLQDQVELLKTNRFFKNRVQLKMELNDLPLYNGIYAHFSQSLGNLIKNAVEAMHAQDNGLLVIKSMTVNHNIIIKISDNGPGIPDKLIKKIFHPFFTTKPLTASEQHPTGTGLGLISCKEMIESYNGEVLVDSKPGKGTMFTVKLPLKKESIKLNGD